jgi:cation:H+ antiporter
MFEQLSPWMNGLVFIVSAVFVWMAGTRLAHYADAIARKTGIGRAFLGLVLLGGVTSLPEMTVAVTATMSGVPALTVNDVLGSAAINVLILALADAAIGRRALTSQPGSPTVLLQAILSMVLLCAVIAPSITGDRVVLGMGGWSWVMLGLYLAAIGMLAKSQGLQSWIPQGGQHAQDAQTDSQGSEARSLRRLIGGTAVAGAVILAAGFCLAKAGEGLANQTGLGTSFFGAVFLGLATSLPEVSTVLASVRMRQYEMAMADVFGTNLFNVTIIVLVDALHPGQPVLLEAGRFSAFAAWLALLLTAVFLIGIIERRDRTIGRLGIDSLAALALYVAGLAILYTLK